MEQYSKKYHYKVYLNGRPYADTWAVSAKKAVNNVLYRIHKENLKCSATELKAKPVWN